MEKFVTRRELSVFLLGISVALLLMLLLFGVYDEKLGKLEKRTDQLETILMRKGTTK